MHIILGVLGAIVTILILVNRLKDNGIDIGWLNPFAWKRRRAWRKQYHADPIYALEHPMEATAATMLYLAKLEGDISKQQKASILSSFESVFHLSEKEATALFLSSSYLFNSRDVLSVDVEKLLKPSSEKFSEEQKRSAIELLTNLCKEEGDMNQEQKKALDKIALVFQMKSSW